MSSSVIALSRAQSVLEVLEEDVRFAFGRFAEGDDVDFIFGLGMYAPHYPHLEKVKVNQQYDLWLI